MRTPADRPRPGSPAAALGVAGLILLTACAAAATDPSAIPPGGAPSPAPRSVTGYITEIELGSMSLRALDGRQLIFWIERSPVPLDVLERTMLDRRPIAVTYVAEEGRLIPLTIEDGCATPTPACAAPSPGSA